MALLVHNKGRVIIAGRYRRGGFFTRAFLDETQARDFAQLHRIPLVETQPGEIPWIANP